MAEFGASGAFARHLTAIRRIYAGQRDALVAAVQRHLPDVEFTRPEGGWFLWLRLRDHLDATRLLARAEAHGVSYLAGTRFFTAADVGLRYLRLSFSMIDDGTAELAIRRLAASLAEP